MKSRSSHIATGSHGSPQGSFFRHNGTYDGVTVAGGAASSIGSYSGCCGVVVVVGFVVGVGIGGVGFGGGCSNSSIPSSVSSFVTVSTIGTPPPCRRRTGTLGLELGTVLGVTPTSNFELGTGLGVIPTLGFDLGTVLGVALTSSVDVGTVLGVLPPLG